MGARYKRLFKRDILKSSSIVLRSSGLKISLIASFIPGFKSSVGCSSRRNGAVLPPLIVNF
jgi:hypothetical protein